MASFSDVISGLTFLASKEGDKKSYFAVNTEHDVIYCDGPKPEELTLDEVQMLKNWGWAWDKEFDCSWRKFT